MKGIVVLALILLAGCAGVTPLEQLEAEALISGDWTAVERRERTIARRDSRKTHCPPGTVGYCEVDFGTNACTCIKSGAMRSFIESYGPQR